MVHLDVNNKFNEYLSSIKVSDLCRKVKTKFSKGGLRHSPLLITSSDLKLATRMLVLLALLHM